MDGVCIAGLSHITAAKRMQLIGTGLCNAIRADQLDHRCAGSPLPLLRTYHNTDPDHPPSKQVADGQLEANVGLSICIKLINGCSGRHLLSCLVILLDLPYLPNLSGAARINKGTQLMISGF